MDILRFLIEKCLEQIDIIYRAMCGDVWNDGSNSEDVYVERGSGIC